MPVILPLVTNMCRDNAVIFMPSGRLASWAMSSKRGRVVLNLRRRQLRSSFSINVEQLSRRNQSLSAELLYIDRKRTPQLPAPQVFYQCRAAQQAQPKSEC